MSWIERRKLSSERDRFHLGALLVANAGGGGGPGCTIEKAEREFDESLREFRTRWISSRPKLLLC
jgi:hypothetical protein